MLFLLRPHPHRVRTLTQRVLGAPFSYPEVGATRDESPVPGHYAINRHRRALGRGRDVFARACSALDAWSMYRVPGMELQLLHGDDNGGAVIAVTARQYGIWSVNPVRVVYRLAEVSRYGFAVGTLPGHEELGEERFLVTIDARENVYYELYSFARPRRLPARLPFARRLIIGVVRRFARDSGAAMSRAVANAGS